MTAAGLAMAVVCLDIFQLSDGLLESGYGGSAPLLSTPSSPDSPRFLFDLQQNREFAEQPKHNLELVLTSSSDEFYILHNKTQSYVVPLYDGQKLVDKTLLTLQPNMTDWAKWKYIPFDDFKGYGAIQHIKSDFYLHPWGDSPNPDLDTQLMVAKDVRYATVFTFFQSANILHHYHGLNFYSDGNPAQTDQNATVKLTNTNDPECIFSARDKYGNIVDVHKPKIIKDKGQWILVAQKQDIIV